MELRELIGKSLDGFRIAEFSHVFMTDCDGRLSKSIGYIEDNDLAMAFAQNQVDAAYHKVDRELVLTDGKQAFVLDETEVVEILDSIAIKEELQKKIKSKLSPAERAVLEK